MAAQEGLMLTLRAGDGGSRLNDRRSRNDFLRAIGFGGSFSLNEWTSFSFRCC